MLETPNAPQERREYFNSAPTKHTDHSRKPTIRHLTTMDAAKDRAHKVASALDPTRNDGKGGSASGLERDMDPKPTKVHLDQEAYVASHKLKDKRALITGGDSGIGRSIAILFAMEGAKVAIVYLPSEEADAQHTKEQVEKNGGVIELIASDLTSSTNCKDVASRVNTALGGVDILVNNAASRQEQQDITGISEYVQLNLP